MNYRLYDTNGTKVAEWEGVTTVHSDRNVVSLYSNNGLVTVAVVNLLPGYWVAKVRED